MSKWVTVGQACVILGMSERSVRRHIADDKMDSKLEGKRRLVKIDEVDDNPGMTVMPGLDIDDMVGWLQNELRERNKQIEKLQEELRLTREYSDKIILKLADELKAQRSILEESQSGRKRDSLFWARLRRSKSDEADN